MPNRRPTSTRTPLRPQNLGSSESCNTSEHSPDQNQSLLAWSPEVNFRAAPARARNPRSKHFPSKNASAAARTNCTSRAAINLDRSLTSGSKPKRRFVEPKRKQLTKRLKSHFPQAILRPTSSENVDPEFRRFKGDGSSASAIRPDSTQAQSHKASYWPPGPPLSPGQKTP